MKKIIIAIAAVIGLGSVASCGDMLETDSSRQLFEPELDKKTDSIFYSFGIMEAMQQLADQYVFQGEMRGELVTTTDYTDKNLRALADFTANTTNKYDSAYLYYRVINNCNYYIAHRDTTLRTGSENVTIREYAAVKAFRAWAYLQLVRTYGAVPFFTEPLTKISQIDNNSFPKLDLQGIVRELAPDLKKYSGMSVPNYNNVAVGSTNWGQSKTINTQLCFIPVDVILGDLYLEAQNYPEAINHYITYFTRVAKAGKVGSRYSTSIPKTKSRIAPSDFTELRVGTNWENIFNANSTQDIISYIPMAVNRLSGATTDILNVFGYDYYAADRSNNCPKLDVVQVQPSDEYKQLSDSTDYYYESSLDALQGNIIVKSTKLGDMRYSAITSVGSGEDSTKVWMSKYVSGNVILYRTTTVWLRLAEAFNRAGYPDAAFAILKDGISANLLVYADYLTDETKAALQTTYPLLSPANSPLFAENEVWGIHAHGAGMSSDRAPSYLPGLSPYTMKSVVGSKLLEIGRKFDVTVGATKQDTINAVEDLICDEYALELAFEGNRYYDLMRLARHKNHAGLYGSSFGSQWLGKKLASRRSDAATFFLSEKNWYLPFE